MCPNTTGNGTVERSSAFNPDTNILVAILVVLLFAGSLIGNSLVIAVVYKNVNKRMRTTLNLFIVNMAASDLLTTVFSFPILYLIGFSSANQSNPEKSTEPAIFCKTLCAVWLLSNGVSLLSLVAISVDRFWAVFFPTKRPLTNRKPSVIVTAIWLFYICLAIIPIVLEPVECGGQLDSLYLNFLYLYFVLYIAIPTVTILVLYPAILIKLWRRGIPGNPSIANQELRNRTNRKVTILAAALTISFAFSWFPFLVKTMKYLIEKPSDYWRKENEPLNNVALVLSYSSCVWNPLICIVLNANFRSGFKTILGTICSCFSVRTSSCCKAENKIAKLTSRAIDCGQELNVIQLTSINNLKGN